MKYRTEKERRLGTICDTYLADVFHGCYYILRDEELAREFTVQAFVEFYQHMDEIKPPVRRAYLMSTARKKAYAWQKENMPSTEEENQ